MANPEPLANWRLCLVHQVVMARNDTVMFKVIVSEHSCRTPPML